MRWTIRHDGSQPSSLTTALYAVALLLPAGVLLLGGAGLDAPARWRYWAGAAGCVLVAGAVFRGTRHRPLQTPACVLPCVVAVGVQWFARPDYREPLPHYALGTLTALGVGLFAAHTVSATGAPALRRAQTLARRLGSRREWPPTLNACRSLPEVKALREALHAEAAPVMPLLRDPRPQVKVAALAALEFRKHWRHGQPDVVLKLAQTAPESAVRTGAVLALGAVQQRMLLESLADCLRDSDPIVRRAAGEALLWDAERRWPWIRVAVHDALGDPRLVKDGPLVAPGGRFPDVAVHDLLAWATEAGPLGVRATQTLAMHYSQQLAAGATPQLIAQLRDVVSDLHSATVLRVELAHLLQQYGHLTEDVIMRLIEPANPSPLRLMAVEAMLHAFPNERAVDVLRDVARQPNRELALSAAVIVQKYLHVDLGLALGEPPPPLHSRQAAEVTRRVIDWARTSAPAAAPMNASGW